MVSHRATVEPEGAPSVSRANGSEATPVPDLDAQLVNRSKDEKVSAISPGPFGTANVSVLSVKGTAETWVHGHRMPLGTASPLQGPIGEAEALADNTERAVSISGDAPRSVVPLR
jgi:hypothetical protein